MMQFRIADTFTSSLTRLNAQEQKAVKMTAFDLQMDPSAPGLSSRFGRSWPTVASFWEFSSLEPPPQPRPTPLSTTP